MFRSRQLWGEGEEEFDDGEKREMEKGERTN